MVNCLTAFFHGRKSITRSLCPFDKLRKGLCGRVVCLTVVHKYVAETKSAADILYRFDYILVAMALAAQIQTHEAASFHGRFEVCFEV